MSLGLGTAERCQKESDRNTKIFDKLQSSLILAGLQACDVSHYTKFNVINSLQSIFLLVYVSDFDIEAGTAAAAT